MRVSWHVCISIGIIYKPPSQMRFLEETITEFESLELNNELYILGDFNINLLFKGKCILNKTHETKNLFFFLFFILRRYTMFTWNFTIVVQTTCLRTS